jgi:predicted GNAT family acetyltransferase
MVFLHLNEYGDTNGLPQSGWGFDFADGTEEPDEEGMGEYGSKEERLPDVTVRIPTKGSNSASSRQFTHRFMSVDYPESEGVKIVEGRTYEGVGCSGQIVGKICGAVFNKGEMGESLQLAGDCLTQEVYEAMYALFTEGGKPKGPFKKKCHGQDYYSILYINGVYVKKDQRGQGLGQEIVRALMHSLYATESSIDLVLLCPAGEPHPGPGMWGPVFDTIASMFESCLQFERCGANNRHTGQSLYMFLEPDEHGEVLDAPVTPAVSENAAVASIVRSAPNNDPVVSAEVATIVKSESSSSAPPVMAPAAAAASSVVKSERRSDPDLAPANVVSSDAASKRQKTS